MSVIQHLYKAGDDGLDHRHSSAPCARLQNLEINLVIWKSTLNICPTPPGPTLVVSFKTLWLSVVTFPPKLRWSSMILEQAENHKPLKQRANRVHKTKPAMIQNEVQYVVRPRLVPLSLLIMFYSTPSCCSGWEMHLPPSSGWWVLCGAGDGEVYLLWHTHLLGPNMWWSYFWPFVCRLPYPEPWWNVSSERPSSPGQTGGAMSGLPGPARCLQSRSLTPTH